MAIPSPQLEAGQSTGIDHVTIAVGEYGSAKRFYEVALRPLGFSVLLDWPDRRRAYLGRPAEGSSVWLVEAAYRGPTSLSFVARDRSAVDAFYAAALAAGARSLADPGLRPEYTPSTYAAEVVDADGNALEAICRHAEPPAHAIAAAA